MASEELIEEGWDRLHKRIFQSHVVSSTGRKDMGVRVLQNYLLKNYTDL